MPIATINILEGRSDEKKEEFIKQVTEAIHKSIDAPYSSIRIILNEMKKQHFGIAGQSAKKMGK